MLGKLTLDLEGYVAHLPLGVLGGAIAQQVEPHLEITSDPQARGAALREDVSRVLFLHQLAVDELKVQAFGLCLDVLPTLPQLTGQTCYRRWVYVSHGGLFDVSLGPLEDSRVSNAYDLVATYAADITNPYSCVSKAKGSQMTTINAVASAAKA